MKKSKHFRKDVITARVIFGIICILLVVLIGIGISTLTKSMKGKENTEDSQYMQDDDIQDPNSEDEPEVGIDTETENSEDTNSEDADSEDTNTESENSESELENTVTYVVTDTEVRLRTEPNTDCEILARIPGGVQLTLLEEIEGWYKVVYEGREGYISADYATILR